MRRTESQPELFELGERPARPTLLASSQLADLVNYVLQLPTKNGQAIMELAIHPCAVSTWTWKGKKRSQLWCEGVLLESGAIPQEQAKRLHVRVGRRKRSAPQELFKIAPKPVGRVQQLIQDRREWRRVAG